METAALADYAEASLVDAAELVERSRLEEPEGTQAYALSAATFDVQGRKIIVTNPLRSQGRLASDIAHEALHLLLRQELSEVRELAETPFMTCSR